MLASIFLYVVQLVLTIMSFGRVIVINENLVLNPIVYIVSLVVGLIATINLYQFNPGVAALMGAIELFFFGVVFILMLVKEILKWVK